MNTFALKLVVSLGVGALIWGSAAYVQHRIPAWQAGVIALPVVFGSVWLADRPTRRRWR